MTEHLPQDSPQLGEHADAYPGLDRAREELTAFVDSKAHDELAALYGAELPRQQVPRLQAMQQLAAKHWDFRKGAERQVVNWKVEGALGVEGSDEWRIVFGAADKLRQVRSSELTNPTPEYLAPLGGANLAPLHRLRFGLEAVDDFGRIVYLGSSRPVNDAERLKAAEYAPAARTEFELGIGAFELDVAYGGLSARLVESVARQRDGDAWDLRLYEFEHKGETKEALAFSTPFTLAGHRATTYDNFNFLADWADFDIDATVAAVTTAFYVPGQHLAGVQSLVLPYGVGLETIGHSAEYSGVTRQPTQLLQEAKSGIDAAVRLHGALALAAA